MFASELLPVVFLMIGLAFVPESPRWLATQGRIDDARGVLAKINSRERAEGELHAVHESIEREKGMGGGFSELLGPGFRIALVIAIGLAVLQHISGGAALTLYAPLIFQKAGYADPGQAIGRSVLLNLCHLVCVVIAILFVERWGRKPLLITGLTIKALGHFTLAWCFENDISGMGFLVIYFITTCVSNISIAPIAWLVMTEIFPNRVRAKGMTLTMFVLFSASYANIHLFPIVSAYFENLRGSPSGVFVLFGLLCVAGVVFIALIVPETKGKTLEQIAERMLKRSKGNG